MTEEASQDTTRGAPLRFQSGGAVRPGVFYIERDADAELLQTLLDGEYCYVLAPRQMGKSSLRVRAGEQLRKHGVRYATVDLQSIGSGKDIKINDWYHSVIDTLNSSLGLNSDLTAFWTQQGQHLTDPDALGRSTLSHSWATFLQREVLAHTTEPIVIFVDEIDSVLSLPFSTDDFFAAIRSAHESRPEHPEYNRLTFCLMGVAAPNDLIRDTTRTPFNIGKSISLDDFTLPQTQKFLGGLSNVNGNSNEYLRAVFSWANGQPYMTHKLCQEIAKLDGQSSGQSEAETVRKLVETTFLQRGRTQDSNLRYAEDRFDQIQSSATKSQLLQLYRRLLHGQFVEVKDDNPAQSELKLTGLAAERQDAKGVILQRRNQIFATVFDEKWIREKEGERLFQEALAKWLEAHQRGASGEEYLLRGEALEEGLAWWRQRYDVTREEREFLLASQELSRTKALAEARWAKRFRTLSGLLIGALIIAIALAAIAFKQNSALVASRYELERRAAELQRSQDNLISKNEQLVAQTERAVSAEKVARDNASKAEANAVELAMTAEKLRKANSELSSAREESAAVLNASRRQLYFAIGNRELQDRDPVRSSVFYAASQDLIDTKHPAKTDALIQSRFRLTAQFVNPLMKDLYNASISPNGTRLVSIVESGTVRLWDAKSGQMKKDLDGDALPQTPWSPDSQHLVTNFKGDTKLWNADTGKFLGDFPGTGSSTLYWSNDGRRLVSAGDSIILWNVESGKEVAKLIEKNADPYAKVAWTTDSKYLATVDENHNVQLYDSEKGRKIKQLATNFNVDPFDGDESVLIGGRGIFLTHTAEALQIWDAESGDAKTLSESTKITEVLLSADSEKVIALDGDKIRLWNTRDGSAMPALDGQFSRFYTLGMGDSLRLITVGLSGEAKLWNGKTGAHMKDLPVVLPRNDFDVEPEFVALGHSKRFALGNGEVVELWDSTTGERLHTLPVKPLIAQTLRWSDDENLVLLQNNPLVPDNQNEPAQIWDAQTGKLLTTLPIMDGYNGLFQISWAGRRLITNQIKDGSLQMWELRFTPQTISELIEDVRNQSGYKIENEELIESRKGNASPRP